MPLRCWSAPPCDDEPVTPPTVRGPVRLASNARALASALDRGEIAVIDVVDLDAETARLLTGHHPAAVLNAADSLSGRAPATGARLLLEAEIPVVDGFGPDLLTLRDGQEVSLDGGVLSVDGEDVVEGEPVTVERVEAAQTAARGALHLHLQTLGGASADLLAREHALIVDGDGLPALGLDRTRPVLVIGSQSEAAEQLRAIRPWIREAAPHILAVDRGVEAARAAGLTPDVVLGSLADVPEDALRAAAHVVLQPGAGAVRLEELGRDYTTVMSSLPAGVLGLLVGCAQTDASVVTAGLPATFDDVVASGREYAAALGLARLRHGDQLVDASAVARLQRPGIRTWQLVLLGILGLLAVILALLTTPVGQAALGLGPDWLANLFSADSAPKEALWSVSATTSFL